MNLDAIKTIKQSLKIPVVANGDICTLDDAKRVKRYISFPGKSSFRGIYMDPKKFVKVTIISLVLSV